MSDDPSVLLLDELKITAKHEMQNLGLSFASPLLELYWICCVASDYNLDYKSTFEKIAVPPGLPLPSDPRVYLHYPKLKSGSRMYPPAVSTSKDIPFYLNKLEFPFHIDKIDEASFWIFIEDEHEFAAILNKMKGRPPKGSKPGAIPVHSDRLAVACASLKKSDSTYVDIAKQFDLPRTEPWGSEQSDIVRHLVKRGAKLLSNNLE